MFNLLKKMFFLFLACFFPWFLFLMNDNPRGALFSLILQVTMIGWPVATLWAWREQYPRKKEKQNNQ